MEAKEKWINETMDSLKNIQSAELSLRLKEKILQNSSFKKGKIISIRPMVKWVAAASIILLIGLNLISVLQYNKSNSIGRSNINPVYSEYFSFVNGLSNN